MGKMKSLLIALGFMISGCAFTQMETAHQLDSGDYAISGSLAWPAALFLPRASVNAIYGLGGVGDISAHAGTSLLTANIGLGGRVYLTDWLTVSLQGDVMTLLIDENVDFEYALVSLTPRLTTAASADNFVYGGIQANFTTFDFGFEQNLVLAGILGGVDYWSPESGLGGQMEIIFNPIAYAGGNLELFTGPEAVVVGQFNVGFYYRTPQRTVDETRLEPTTIEERAPQRPAEPDLEPEPEPEPEFDDGGVPLY